MTMPKKKIIPVFVPQGGCENHCVFCNQRGITGVEEIPGDKDLDALMPPGGSDYELAFYGGTFTALPQAVMISYLEFAEKMYKAGRIGSLRISTHPKALDEEMMPLLKHYGVTTIELGIQSMDDEVLAEAGRGHTAEDNRYAMFLVKNNGFSLGVQLMTGLPFDTSLKVFKGLYELLPYSPSMVRIYPLLVLQDTPLAISYQKGEYLPMSLEEAVALVTDMYAFFRYYRIPVIRMGLQPTEELNCGTGLLLAGPFHPAFGHLVKSLLKRKQVEPMLKAVTGDVTVMCHEKDLPLLYGEHREHFIALNQQRRLRISGTLKDRDVLALAPYEQERQGEILSVLTEQEFLTHYLSERVECI